MSDQNNNNSLYENSEYPSRQRRTADQHPRRRPRKKRGSTGNTILKVLGTLFLVGLCTGAVLCCFGAYYVQTVILPEVEVSMDDFQLGENSVMYYQDKETGRYVEMTTLLSSTSSVWVDLEEMPKYLPQAAVAIEDQRFYTHPGVDWKRTAKAVLDMFLGNDISGGSTITQQLIKNMTDYNETTVKRKVTEIFRAIRFTQNNSKDDTLEMYLNIIPLGAGCEGVGSASLKYFGKPVSELTLAECASLVGITNNPSKYGPYSFAKSKTSTGEVWDARQWNKYRQEVILGEMLKQGMISQEEHDEAVAQELVFVRAEGEEAETEIYNWYEETVISDVRADLKEKYGFSDSRLDQIMARGGLRIYTCMDPEIQAIAEAVYEDRANLNYTSKSGQQMQSSITIIDNETGDVAAIVGRFGEKTENRGMNYANAAKRQPGSSIKPLTVYAPALEMGKLSPISVLDDYPYDTRTGSAWPLNSGGNRYRGLTTLKDGLMRSANTIAVRVVADYVTPQESFSFGKDKFKLDLVDAVQSGDQIMSDIDISPMAMGGLTAGVSSRTMAQAYATFPSAGVYTYSRTYTRVTQLVDGEEVVLLENEPEKEQVLKESTAYYMNTMLQRVISGSGAGGDGHTGGEAALSGMRAAGKTGTTSDNFDRWFVGYTPYYTAAVWTGYEQNEKMKTGSANPAAVLWKKVMSQVHEGLENKKFPEVSGLKQVTYCLDSGLLAGEYCALDPRGSRVATDYIFPEDYPDGRTCTVHTAESVVKVCVDSPILNEDGTETGLYHIAGPYCPEESLREVCYPNYEREKVGSAVAQDEMYRFDVVEAQGTCTVHTEAPVVQPDPSDPNFPWDPSQPVDPNDPGSGSQTDPSGSGSGSGSDSPPPSQDIPQDQWP